MKSIITINHCVASLAMLGLVAMAPVHADTPNHMENRADHVNELKNASQGTSESYEAEKNANAKNKRSMHRQKNQAELLNDKDAPATFPSSK